jgi:hypothetical protein
MAIMALIDTPIVFVNLLLNVERAGRQPGSQQAVEKRGQLGAHHRAVHHVRAVGRAGTAARLFPHKRGPSAEKPR